MRYKAITKNHKKKNPAFDRVFQTYNLNYFLAFQTLFAGL